MLQPSNIVRSRQQGAGVAPHTFTRFARAWTLPAFLLGWRGPSHTSSHDLLLTSFLG